MKLRSQSFPLTILLLSVVSSAILASCVSFRTSGHPDVILRQYLRVSFDQSIPRDRVSKLIESAQLVVDQWQLDNASAIPFGLTLRVEDGLTANLPGTDRVALGWYVRSKRRMLVVQKEFSRVLYHELCHAHLHALGLEDVNHSHPRWDYWKPRSVSVLKKHNANSLP